MKKIIYHKRGHLGDCVHTMHYIKRLLLKYPDLIIEFYIKPEYIKEISLLIEKIIQNRISILDVKNYVENSGVNAWYGELWLNGIDLVKLTSSMPHDWFFIKWFGQVSQKLGLENPFKEPKDFLMDNENILKQNVLSKKYDFLIINSIPLSGQVNGNEVVFQRMIDNLSKKYSIITTRKCKNHLCTLDYNLSLVDIANISLNCNKIISIATSPLILCLNKWTIETCKEILIICQAFDLRYDLGKPNKFKLVKSIRDCEEFVNTYYL